MKGLVAAAALAMVFASHQSTPAVHAQLVIVVDGLRPDQVTEASMPRLVRLGRRGTVFTAHHSVFPTVTRVNGASMVTGAYPETHGLLGNTVYVPSVDPLRGLDTGRRENLERIARVEGRLLTAPTLADILSRHGRSLVALGSGTTGAVFVLNDAVPAGAVIHPDYSRPPELQTRIVDKLGPPPKAAMPNTAQHRRIVDAYLSIVLPEIGPAVAWMWLNDPDVTAHARGLGAAPSVESLSIVDAEIGRIEDALAAGGRLERTNIIVTSDHGFSTHTGALRLAELVRPFVKSMPDGSPDIVVAEGAVYLRSGRDLTRERAIVQALQSRPEVGAIFTRPAQDRGIEGFAPGTLSLDMVRWRHARSADILVSANWTADANDRGISGTTTQSGTAGHGTSSPFDIHNILIAAGPDFRQQATSGVPTSSVDLAPTLLKLLGISPPPTMTGRVIEEGLRNGPSPASIRVTHDTRVVKTGDGSYALRADYSIAAGKRYLDSTQVVRRTR
jgi:arylsulfatase A-like enzyme